MDLQTQADPEADTGQEIVVVFFYLKVCLFNP